MMDRSRKAAGDFSSGSVKAALGKIAKAQAKQQGDLAAALRKVSGAQTPKADENLKAALDSIAHAQAKQQGDLAAALRKVSAAQTLKAEESLKAAVFGTRNPVAHERRQFDSVHDAWRAGARDGVRQLGALSLNPWLRPPNVLREEPFESLQQDWRCVEQDLWAVVERLRDRLHELPQPAREEFLSALVRYLRST